MCGLTFVINRNSLATRLGDFFSDAMIANQVRGLDAAGLFQIDRTGSLFCKKKAVSASELLRDSQVQHIIRDANRCPLTVGHVRHATSGDRYSDSNAHPFVFERDDGSKVVGVHNGTLKGWRDKRGGEEKDVDSAWAIGLIAEDGLDAFASFNGAYAFIWWDSMDPDSVWIARNSERTLFYYISDDGQTILGASELGMLGWLAERNGYSKHKNGYTGLHYFEPGKAYKLSTKNVGQIKSFLLPTYDPTTTIKEVSAPKNAASTWYPHGGSRGEAHDNEGPFEMGPTGKIGATTNGRETRTTTRGTPTTTDSDKKWMPNTEPVIIRAKLALRRARDKRLGHVPSESEPVRDPQTDQVITSEHLDENLNTAIRQAMHKAASDKKLNPWDFTDGDRTVEKPQDRMATEQEIKTAVFSRVYGRVVPLVGIHFDEHTNELLGEAYVRDEKGKSITIDCVLRGMTEKLANDVYIKGSDPVLVSIIGEIEPKGLEPPMYVVATLSLANRIELGRQLLRKESSSVIAL